MEQYRCTGCGSTVTVDTQNDAVEFQDAHRVSCGEAVAFELVATADGRADERPR
jgi:hypothetical protein